MKQRFTKITAEDIKQAAKYGRFGDDGPVQVVCHGLLQIAGGFRTGGTVTSILKDMKLIGIKSGEPTKLGKLFLYDLLNGANFVERLESNVTDHRGPAIYSIVMVRFTFRHSGASPCWTNFITYNQDQVS